MTTQTLVIPLDGSTVADAVLPYAQAIARATGAALLLVTAVEPTPGEALGLEINTTQRNLLLAHLGVTADRLRAAGFTVATSLLDGYAADEIVATADEDPGAMIVMATHARAGLDRWLLGSVADKVMRTATRPTLLIRPPDTTPSERAEPAFRRVMVPLDGSALAAAALPVVAELATTLGATITLVFAESWIAAGSVESYAVDTTQLNQEVAEAARMYLETARRQLPAGLQVKTEVLRGPAAAALVDFAQREQIDLIMMSTHGRGGMRRFVLGSIADRLVRCGVPVLLLRPAAGESEAAATVQSPVEQKAPHCAACGRLILFAVGGDERCPRCRIHLHACANCVFWDTTACVLQRPEVHDQAWPGRGCPRFVFRETPPRPQPSARPDVRGGTT